jgi:hypothetical protein
MTRYQPHATLIASTAVEHTNRKKERMAVSIALRLEIAEERTDESRIQIVEVSPIRGTGLKTLTPKKRSALSIYYRSVLRRRQRMAREPLKAELFREAVAIAVDDAKREERIFPDCRCRGSTPSSRNWRKKQPSADSDLRG